MMAYIHRIIISIITCFCALVQAHTIMVYGDSLSAGYGLKTEEGWVHLLSKDLGSKHLVVNASMSGETTAGGLQRLQKSLQQHKPSIVILELGGNDALRGLPINQSTANLNQMIQEIHKQRAKIILLGIDIPPNFGKTYRTEFSNMYTQLSKKHHITLVDNWLNVLGYSRKWFQPDGIHPTAEAQPLLLKPIQSQLYPMLK